MLVEDKGSKLASNIRDILSKGLFLLVFHVLSTAYVIFCCNTRVQAFFTSSSVLNMAGISAPILDFISVAMKHYHLTYLAL